jgi:hypothetical protein
VNVIELARGRMIDGQTFIIRLDRDAETSSEVVVLMWPPQPTSIEPKQLAETTTTVVTTLAEARVQLRLIRGRRRRDG